MHKGTTVILPWVVSLLLFLFLIKTKQPYSDSTGEEERAMFTKHERLEQCLAMLKYKQDLINATFRQLKDLQKSCKKHKGVSPLVFDHVISPGDYAPLEHSIPPEFNLPPSLSQAEQENGQMSLTKVNTAAKELEVATIKTAKNPHPFKFIINPQHICTRPHGESVFLLVVVHSAPAHVKHRQAIRQTWGELELLKQYNATLVFIIGTVPNTTLTELLWMESDQYNDIVQEDFLDTYRNLTYKAIAAFKWAAIHCPNVTYILKSDDDVVINFFRLNQYIRKVVVPDLGDKRVIACYVYQNVLVKRDITYKWFITEKEYPDKYFPPYCAGAAFLLSADLAEEIYEISLDTPYFRLDDVYITGIIAKRMNLRHYQLSSAYSIFNPDSVESIFRRDTKRLLMFLLTSELRVFHHVWYLMQKQFFLSRTENTTTPPSNSTLKKTDKT